MSFLTNRKIIHSYHHLNLNIEDLWRLENCPQMIFAFLLTKWFFILITFFYFYFLLFSLLVHFIFPFCFDFKCFRLIFSAMIFFVSIAFVIRLVQDMSFAFFHINRMNRWWTGTRTKNLIDELLRVSFFYIY